MYNNNHLKNDEKWCWTKPIIDDKPIKSRVKNVNQSFPIKKSELVGGINWGFCMKDISSQQIDRKINYNIYLTTSHMCHSETSSPIFAIFHGNQHTSESKLIFPNGIKKGQILKTSLRMLDLGVLIGVKVSCKISKVF